MGRMAIHSQSSRVGCDRRCGAGMLLLRAQRGGGWGWRGGWLRGAWPPPDACRRAIALWSCNSGKWGETAIDIMVVLCLGNLAVQDDILRGTGLANPAILLQPPQMPDGLFHSPSYVAAHAGDETSAIRNPNFRRPDRRTVPFLGIHFWRGVAGHRAPGFPGR